MAAVGVGDALLAETLNNYLVFGATQVLSNPIPPFAAAEIKASQDTIASNISVLGGLTNALLETVRMKVYVRTM
jgi:hypothetical protein